MSEPLFDLAAPEPKAPRGKYLPIYRLSLVREGREPYDPAGHPAAAARFIDALCQDEPAECMGVLFLDQRHRVIGASILYRSGFNRAAVEPRGLLAAALLANAGGIICFHNHPSGDPSPSAEDLTFTRRLAEAGEIIGVRLMDHVIVGGNGQWISLRQRGAW